jgi:hypothetical protein
MAGVSFTTMPPIANETAAATSRRSEVIGTDPVSAEAYMTAMPAKAIAAPMTALDRSRSRPIAAASPSVISGPSARVAVAIPTDALTRPA